jgi:hypothetical protein
VVIVSVVTFFGTHFGSTFLFSIIIGLVLALSISYFSCSKSLCFGFTIGFLTGVTILTRSILPPVALEVLALVFPYFLILLMAVLNFSIGTPIVFAISQIRRGLASASPLQNAGFIACQKIKPPQAYVQANHFDNNGLRLDQAICHWIFFPVYCSINLIIS